MLIKWDEIKPGDQFDDGSYVLDRHEPYCAQCYSIQAKGYDPMILSADHLLLCDYTHLDDDLKMWLEKNFAGYAIPTLLDRHVYIYDLVKYLEMDDNSPILVNTNIHSIIEQVASLNPNMSDAIKNPLNIQAVEDDAVCWDVSNPTDHEMWLPVALIHELVNRGCKLFSGGNEIIHADDAGELEVFCVGTNTHKFESNGLIHHNSVTLRNIILHCLTHGEEICIALVDLKYTEFEFFKGIKNVVAVANTVRECAEILRIQREVMYKRNQEMSKLGLNDIKDFKPKKATNEVMIFNRKFSDDETVEIRLNGQVQTVTVRELEGYLS